MIHDILKRIFFLKKKTHKIKENMFIDSRKTNKKETDKMNKRKIINNK